MRQSLLLFKVQKEKEKETAKSAILLERGSFLHQLSSGVYNFLPLGFRVLKKIEKIIREEMEKIGAQELILAALHPKELWHKTGRWEKMSDLYKLKENHKEWALGPTHEEVITPLVKNFIHSYRDLPISLFQIQLKFRKELRPKSGLLRTKEFLMKDLYSFHANEQDLDNFYEKVKESYFRIFERVDIAKDTFLTLAGGGTFSDFSHEFQTKCEFGEDQIFVCKNCHFAINRQIKDQFDKCPECQGKEFFLEKTIEVGNIFKLKTRFSEVFDLKYLSQDGKKKLVWMGCYGIGLGRLMATIVERHFDEKGIIWPKEVAPYLLHLIPIGKVKKEAEKLYFSLLKDFEILYDDREKMSPGEKFFDADLIGIPIRLVLSERTLKKKGVEIKL
ncbi:hypothetical protein H5T58_01555, partial [Candidatus Parcubacteria bacterium]|nr:hypothetical protein [Candidatus Parcubacteria bacterium]